MMLSRDKGARIEYFQNGGWFHGYVDTSNLFDSYTGFMRVWQRGTLIRTFVNPARVDVFSLHELNEDEMKTWESICDGKKG